ncbi:LPP20 family lipoprotein [Sulfurimonas sp. HSL3-2]|uniref:LPP20 family lipoprotein n=1 Tax=Hydrocurvibacter mobilis TaxID=3131936 RepID=UPI0031F9F677
MKFTIIAAILLFFTGCYSDLPIEVEQKPVSSWISNPPKSDSSTLYALGEGKDQYEALANGLSQMVSTLSVSVKSQYDATTKVKNVNGVELYTNDVEQKVSSSVKELRVPSYEIINYEQVGFNSYAVLIRSDKKLFFQSIKNEVDNTIKLLKDDEKSYKSSNILKRLAFYKQTSASVDDLVYRSIVLKVLNPEFDESYIINEASRFKTAYISLKSKISFSITADKDSQNLVPVVKEVLTAKGFKITKQNSGHHLHVGIRSNIVYTTAYGFDLARSAVDISIKDSSNQTVLAKKIDITGQSTQGYEVAKQNIASKLKKYIIDSEIL